MPLGKFGEAHCLLEVVAKRRVVRLQDVEDVVIADLPNHDQVGEHGHDLAARLVRNLQAPRLTINVAQPPNDPTTSLRASSSARTPASQGFSSALNLPLSSMYRCLSQVGSVGLRRKLIESGRCQGTVVPLWAHGPCPQALARSKRRPIYTPCLAGSGSGPPPKRSEGLVVGMASSDVVLLRAM